MADSPEPHRSNWHRATLANLTTADLKLLLELAYEFERKYGRSMSPEELAQALRQE